MTTTILAPPIVARASIPLPRNHQARLLLAACSQPDSLTEIRWWRRGDRPQQRWFASSVEAADFAVEQAGTADVYFGVIPRARQAGGRDALVSTARVLWAECDQTMASQRALALRPHLMVKSSLAGKTHAYWLIRERLPLADVERANRRLAFSLGADMRTCDAARILRVPGTLHWKTGEPLPVEIIHADCALNHPGADVVGALPDPFEPVRSAPARPRIVNLDHDRLSVIPADVYVPVLTRRELHGRFVQCPWHKDGRERTPSLSVGGPEDSLYLCFGCGESGDIFRLAARMWSLDERTQFPQILERLKQAFG